MSCGHPFCADRSGTESVSIMLAMYDEKEILRDYIESERYDAAKETAIEMLKGGKLSVEEIAQYVPALSVDDVKKLQKELMQCV